MFQAACADKRIFEGKDILPAMQTLVQQGLNDKYSDILFPVVQGLVSWRFGDWSNFGNYLHNAKLKAAALHLHQVEYFCDLMIGYAYQNLGDTKKTRQIFTMFWICQSKRESKILHI